MSASTPELRLVGRILTPFDELSRALVLVRDGRIVSLEPWSGAAPPGALELEGWIAPGFIDLQVNGFAGQDFADPAADLELASTRLAEHGVTSFLPTLISAPLDVYLERLPKLDVSLPGARAIGVHLEGPFISAPYRGAHAERHLRPLTSNEVDRLLRAGAVRMMTLAPELPGALPTIHQLASGGVLVSLGHSDATFEQASAALDAGARAGTHLFNAMRPFRHRDPGLSGALLIDDRATVGVIADGIHLHPAALSLAYRAKGRERLALVTDASAAAGKADGSYRLGDLEVHVRGREARLLDGTLAGSTLTMDAAVRNMIAATGCAVREAVAMATTNPAEALGLPNKGKLVTGADADLVVLSPLLEVEQTYVGGRLVFDRKKSD